MKKIALILIFITGLTAFSQELSYGMGIGPTVSTIAKVPFESPTATQGELGYFIYAFGEYKLSEKISLYNKLGIDDRVAKGVFPADNFVNIKFLSLMPAVKIDLGGEDPNSGVFFKSGLRLSQLLSAKDKDADVDIKDGFNGTNLGFNIAFGGDFAKHYTFELLTDFGITSETKDNDSKFRFNTLMFLIEINIESLIRK